MENNTEVSELKKQGEISIKIGDLDQVITTLDINAGKLSKRLVAVLKSQDKLSHPDETPIRSSNTQIGLTLQNQIDRIIAVNKILEDLNNNLEI